MGWARNKNGEEEEEEEEETAYRLLLGKPEGRRPLERPRRRWVDNVNMDLDR
jgi:hypothetical protein